MAGKLTLEPDMDHLRFSGAAPADQLNVLQRIIESDSMLPDILRRMEELGLPDCWLGSGAIYNTVWNVLTGRPAHQGIKDIDVVYFDASDLSYEAEDAIIRRAAAHFADCPLPVELRNQARVHLWFPGWSAAPICCSIFLRKRMPWPHNWMAVCCASARPLVSMTCSRSG
jgi:hypothetical protein